MGAATISDVRQLRPARHLDGRGFFAEIYNFQRLSEQTGFTDRFVQDNISLSTQPGTIRGLHFQSPPRAQHKLIGVLQGAIWDVAVDLRVGSPSYGGHVACRLDADTGMQMLVPAGFGHGFCTLEPNTLVLYKVSDFYSPAHDHGVLWNDPALDISWPISAADAIVSEKDSRLPVLRDLPEYFRYGDC